MKRHFPTNNDSPAPTQMNTPLTRGDLTDPEKLIRVAQRHYATGFPNERRVGCPAPGVIQAARVDQMPTAEIRAHLFRCSECFNEFSSAILAYYQPTASNTAAANWRT
ncbi:MAG TPA: hypothetical protein VJ810_11110, partial [Blastocatellia bacterium]|nr:hypothetical protein [Blastocatellia bacterium]